MRGFEASYPRVSPRLSPGHGLPAQHAAPYSTSVTPRTVVYTGIHRVCRVGYIPGRCTSPSMVGRYIGRYTHLGYPPMYTPGYTPLLYTLCTPRVYHCSQPPIPGYTPVLSLPYPGIYPCSQAVTPGYTPVLRL